MRQHSPPHTLHCSIWPLSELIISRIKANCRDPRARTARRPRRRLSADLPVDVLGQAAQAVAPHVQPLQRRHAQQARRDAVKGVHGQVQAIQTPQTAQLEAGSEREQVRRAQDRASAFALCDRQPTSQLRSSAFAVAARCAWLRSGRRGAKGLRPSFRNGERLCEGDRGASWAMGGAFTHLTARLV